MTVRREPWGTTRDGEPVELFTLEADGLRARLTNFGATLVSLEVPDRDGRLADVVLGFDTLAEYDSPRNPYFGGIVGRCANRIAGARFSLNGREHVLAANEGKNHLHGGLRGFDRCAWRTELEGDRWLGFHHRSADGDEGYPGNLEVSARYFLTADPKGLVEQGGHLMLMGVQLCAHTDAPTPCNLTQHSYFNLAGSGTILEHELQVFASRYVAVDDELIPTGKLKKVKGTPFDFRTPRTIGARIAELADSRAGGYDLCYVLDAAYDPEDLDPEVWLFAPPPVVAAARLRDPASGRTLVVHTNAPGLQLYSGNRIDGIAGKAGVRYPRYGGLCLETQHFPDAVHHPAFPSVVLLPGMNQATTTIWAFSAG